MAISAPDLQAYLLAIRETGATSCSVTIEPPEAGGFSFKVDFPPPEKETPEVVVPPQQRTVQSPKGRESGYHELFHGQLPGFRKEQQ